MRQRFWYEDLLAWPLVVLIAYAAVSLVAVDYAWRRITMPFESLMIYAAIIDAIAGALILGAFTVQRRRTRTPSA